MQEKKSVCIKTKTLVEQIEKFDAAMREQQEDFKHGPMNEVARFFVGVMNELKASTEYDLRPDKQVIVYHLHRLEVERVLPELQRLTMLCIDHLHATTISPEVEFFLDYKGDLTRAYREYQSIILQAITEDEA